MAQPALTDNDIPIIRRIYESTLEELCVLADDGYFDDLPIGYMKLLAKMRFNCPSAFDFIVKLTKRWVLDTNLSESKEHLHILVTILEFSSESLRASSYVHLLLGVLYDRLPLYLHMKFFDFIIREEYAPTNHHGIAPDTVATFREFGVDPYDLSHTRDALMRVQHMVIIREIKAGMSDETKKHRGRLIDMFVENFYTEDHDDAWEEAELPVSKAQYVLSLAMFYAPSRDFVDRFIDMIMYGNGATLMEMPCETHSIMRLMNKPRLNAEYSFHHTVMMRIMSVARTVCTPQSMQALCDQLRTDGSGILEADDDGNGNLDRRDLMELISARERHCVKACN